MTPDFHITADSQDITAAIRQRLISLRVRDESGLESDTCEIRLDDRPPHITLPRTGAVLAVALGYRPQLVGMGRWTVDEPACSGWPAELTIRARAADLREGLKGPKERSWPDGTTLGEIVSSIATEHGFVPVVSADLAQIAPPHIDQTESDLHLLTRLAREHDALAKVAGGRLIFAHRAEAQSATGKPLSSVSLSGRDLGRYEATWAERGKYGAVVAHYHDTASGERVEVKTGAAEPVMTLRRTYPDAESARSAAESRLAALARGAATLTLSCPGDVRLMAEARLQLTGVRPGVDGEWSIVAVEHIIDGSGYRCEIEAETPKEDI